MKLAVALLSLAIAVPAAAEGPFADRMEPFSTQTRCMAKLSEALAAMSDAESRASLYQGMFAETADASVQPMVSDLSAIYAEISRLTTEAAQAHMAVCQAYSADQRPE